MHATRKRALANPCGPAAAKSKSGGCACVVFQSPIPLVKSTSAKESILHSSCCSSLVFAGRAPGDTTIDKYSYDPAEKHWRVSTVVRVTHNQLEYQLTEFHLHMGGEHTLDGHKYPVEVHFVFESANGQVLVLAWLAKPAKVSAKQATKKRAKRSTAEALSGSGVISSSSSSSFFRHLLANKPVRIPAVGSHWNYPGSLTTPPFTKSVNWLVSSHLLQISAADLEALKPLSKRERPLQQREGRDIAFVAPRR